MQVPAPRLSVGIISAGAVGTTLAAAFHRAGHHVHGIFAPSARSRELASEIIPNIPRVPLEEAAHTQLVVLAVPDPQLPQVIEEVAAITRAGQMVAHTSGAHGCGIMQPITDTGALPLALHPAMTFTRSAADVEHLYGCGWGITADSDIGYAVAEVLIQGLGGVPVPIAEERRTAYHAALAHAANHLVTVVSDAHHMLTAALGADGDSSTSSASALLRAIVGAAARNALADQAAALTGPASRDDAPAVLRHLDALRELSADSGVAGLSLEKCYLPLAERTAQLADAIDVENALADYRMRHHLPRPLR